MQTTSHPLEHSEQGRAFLQARVGLFGRIAAYIGLFFLAYRAVLAVFGGRMQDFRHPSMVFHALAALSLLGVWLACRGRARSSRYIRKVELVGVLLAGCLYSAMGTYIPLISMPHYIVILSLGLFMLARAIYVPSSSRRTAVLTGLVGIPLLVSVYLTYHQMDVEPWAALTSGGPLPTAHAVALSLTTWSAAWWLCIVLLASGASRVIYGLRKEVRKVRQLGQYTLIEKLGEGGMGIVYRASHAMLRRPTAVKLLPADRAGHESLARFEKEVQLTARLTHPNTVTIFDYGRTPEGVFYYAMELLDGATLAELVAVDGPQPAARVSRILDQIAGALAEAHAINLIHRDIKPANIMLVEQGGKPDVSKVLDFGLVKDLARTSEAELTLADAITGTPQYLSPEGIRAPDSVDGRSDLYALGAIGYFLLTGKHVFSGGTVVEVCAQHLSAEPVPPSQRLGKPIPADLEALLLDCLAKDPAARPQSALEFQQRLQACDDVEPWTAEQARAWWVRCRAELEAMQATQALTGEGLTMAIELKGRDGHPG